MKADVAQRQRQINDGHAKVDLVEQAMSEWAETFICLVHLAGALCKAEVHPIWRVRTTSPRQRFLL